MTPIQTVIAFLETSGFVPHGYCLMWRWDLVSLHVVSDIVIAVSYLTIPFFIFRVLKHRGDIQFRAVPILFACFITACAITHVFGLATMWFAVYGIQGVFKLICALISALTAVMIWRLYPDIVNLPSPRQLEEKNRQLQEEFAKRMAAKEQLRAAHAELTRVNHDLEERVARRTEALQHANEELERFAYVACHDLRAPLRALMSVPEWMRETLIETYGEVTEDLAVDLDELEVQSRRMDKLLSDLLSYARIGQTEETTEEIDIAEHVHNAARLAGLPEGFRIELDGDLPRVRAVPAEFDLVLRNLIGNAVKHHDRDTGVIRIHALRDGDRVAIEVSDDGPGIPEAYATKIFEMFSTLKPRDDVEGSGMGLAMVKKIVERVGSQVRLLQTGAARGATFRFDFPAGQPLAEGT